LLKHPTSSTAHCTGDFVDIPTECALIAPVGSDTVRFINFPNDLTLELKTFVKENWRIQNYHQNKSLNDSYQFKLRGYPFLCTGTSALRSRIFQMKLIKMLMKNGYKPETGFDVTLDMIPDSQSWKS